MDEDPKNDKNDSSKLITSTILGHFPRLFV